MNTVRFTLCILLLGFCSGCATLLGHMGGDDLPPPYNGVVGDYYMGTSDQLACGPWWFLDMPFSLVGDTLFLPCDWYYTHEKKLDQEFQKHAPPVLPDPLAGWKRIDDGQPDQKIVQDYQGYIENLPPLEKQTFRTKQFGVWFYEDGDGIHAIAIPIPLDGTNWQHDLFYDENNHRTKSIKYAAGYYRK